MIIVTYCKDIDRKNDFVHCFIKDTYFNSLKKTITLAKIDKMNGGLSRDLNPGPLAPEARIIPLDH
jgi:hypothetical protein